MQLVYSCRTALYNNKHQHKKNDKQLSKNIPTNAYIKKEW